MRAGKRQLWSNMNDSLAIPTKYGKSHWGNKGGIIVIMRTTSVRSELKCFRAAQWDTVWNSCSDFEVFNESNSPKKIQDATETWPCRIHMLPQKIKTGIQSRSVVRMGSITMMIIRIHNSALSKCYCSIKKNDSWVHSRLPSWKQVWYIRTCFDAVVQHDFPWGIAVKPCMKRGRAATLGMIVSYCQSHRLRLPGARRKSLRLRLGHAGRAAASVVINFLLFPFFSQDVSKNAMSAVPQPFLLCRLGWSSRSKLVVLRTPKV